MSEVDLPTRLERYGGEVELRRIALSETDIGPALASFDVDSKQKDPRWEWYRKQSVLIHGPLCWELDALNPVILRKRVESEISKEIDWQAWERCAIAERAEQESLARYLGKWEAICGQASK